MTNQDCKDYLWKLLAYGILFSQLNMTDGGSVTWYKPPPVVTTSNHLLVLTADSRQILEGSTNVPLRWNFSLTADTHPITLITVTLKLNTAVVATIVASTGQIGIGTTFQGRYNVSWIPQVATVTIFNVSAEDNGEFGCEVTTLEGANIKVWKRKVTVEVVGVYSRRSLYHRSCLTLFTSQQSSPWTFRFADLKLYMFNV